VKSKKTVGPLSEAVDKGFRGRKDYWEERVQMAGIHKSVFLETPPSRIYKFDTGHKYLLSLMSKNKHVLELGCGPGRQLSAFELCSSYIGIDFIDHYVKEANLRLDALRVHNPKTYNKYKVELGDARSLKLESFPHKFDLIVGITTISSLEDNFYSILESLKELANPGGYFVWLEEAWMRIDYIDYDWNLDWIKQK
jgi:SAM-dependent methyltransferase